MAPAALLVSDYLSGYFSVIMYLSFETNVVDHVSNQIACFVQSKVPNPFYNDMKGKSSHVGYNKRLTFMFDK